MNNDIKGILDKLKDSVDNPIDTEVDQFTEEAYDVPNYFVLDPTTNECKVLLDYITNLQEENKELNRMCEIYSKSLYNADLTKAENKINKAIEYIKENEFYLDYKTGACIKGVIPLLNILQGSDKE